MSKTKEQKLQKNTIELKAQLAAKAFQLKIESSLERVRVVAMAMKEPADMLKIGKTISQQLSKLGINEIRNVQTAIFYPGRNTYMNYEYYAKHDKIFITETTYNNNKIHKAFALKMQKGKGEFFITHIKGKKLKEWIAYQKTTNVFIDKYLNTASSLSYYWYSLGPVALGISTYFPLNENEENLFKKFLNVFELAYRRYLDIEKAEAQAREVQIELALERVRARTMAMQKSDELRETSFLLFQQLKELGKTAAQLSIGIVKEEEGFVELSATVHGNPMLQTYSIPADEPFMMKKAVKAWKEKKRSLIIKIEGKRLKEYNSWRNSVLKRKIVFPEKQWIVNLVFFSKGMLSFSSDKEISKETFQLLERFANVFDGTYTRFLDLQKAETQAREAEIELALERVRAKTMAMQKSEELKETTLVLFQQFKALGATAAQVSICLFDEEAKMGEMFVTLKGEKIDRSFPMELDKEVFVMKKAKKAFLKKQKNFSYIIKGKELQNYNHWRNLLIGKKGWDESDAVRKQAWHVDAIFFSGGMMGISSETPASDEAIKLLDRFANVFDLAYTRFNDLKKAEAQAREAQIQLALERVRARTMAMQKSDELAETAVLLFHQLMSLGLDLRGCGFNIWEKGEKTCTAWMTGPDGTLSQSFKLPLTEDPFFIRYNESRQKGEDFWVYETGKEELVARYKYLQTLPDLGELLAKEQKDGMQTELPPFVVDHVVNFSNGNLIFITYERCPEAWDTLKRFGKLFEQTYTRFLDLQKAEAQAREAKIEAALEKVRSRTMAMQKSDELPETSYLLFQQVKELGEMTVQNSIGIVNEEAGFVELSSTVQGHHLPHTLNVPIDDPYLMAKAVAAWKAKRKSLKLEFAGQELKDYNEHRNSFFETKVNFPEDQWIVNIIFFSKGWLSFSSNKNISDETFDLLKKFTSVFEQTYIRFSDLQQAEAQAREAQIEAALERVRSRSMGMQKSAELKEVIQVVYEQFGHLNIHIEHTGFLMDYKERDDMHIWLADQHLVPSEVTIPFFDSPPNNSIKEAKEKEQDFFKYLLTFEEKNKFYRDLFKFVPGVPEETLEYYFNCPGLAGSGVLLDNIGLYIENFSGISYTDEDNNVLMRFGKVFQQTYTRFLDLQKAEAQAREAEIELGLERVRARAMAMQKSDELSELVETVFKELTKLDFALNWCIINIIDESSMSNTVWAANPDINKVPESYHLLFEDYPFHHAMMKGYKEKRTKYVYTLEGQEKKIYDEYLFNETEFRKVPEAAQAASRAMEKYVVSFTFSNFGGLQTVGDVPLSDANLDILSRFGKVFDLTYTRFNDLKQAEAQAREAKVEAALEKVRGRSLAMHKSDELNDVVTVLFEKLKELKIPVTAVGITIYIEGSKDMNVYVCGDMGNGLAINNYLLPYFNHPIANDFYDVHKKGLDFFVGNYSKEEKNSFYKYVLKLPGLKTLPDEIKNMIMQSPSYSVAMAPAKNSMIAVNDFEGKALSENEADILKRFAKVFDQAYIRFLDLQKAEAQAREAKIEAALEKVRSRTMAMQRSDELSETAAILFQEFKKLGEEDLLQLTIGIYNEAEGTIEFRVTSWAGGGAQVDRAFNLSIEEPTLLKPVFTAWKEGKKSVVVDLTGQQLEGWLKYRNAHTGVTIRSEDTSGRRVVTVAFFSKGHISISSPELKSPETIQLLERFAAVFDLTYTRFLDLQKAEAQAREAQIQLALERVRARTMAMQKQNDLLDVLNLLVEQLIKLGVNLEVANFSNQIPSEDWNLWIEVVIDDGTIFNNYVHFPRIDHPYFQQVEKNIETFRNDGTDLFKDVFSKEEKDSWQDYIHEQTIYKDIVAEEVKQSIYDKPGYTWSMVILKDTWVSICRYNTIPFSDEDDALLKRFANAFGQAYTRFLDLQKAEAQAREAQIEASLERVRAKAMAMHNSEDVTSATVTMFTELEKLGVENFRCGINHIKTDRTQEVWSVTNSDGGKTLIAAGSFQVDAHPFWELMYKAWINKKEYLQYHLAGKEKEDYVGILNATPNYLSQPIKEFPDIYFQVYFFGAGSVWAISLQPHPEEVQQIMKRFASVFSLTFRRYQDLQKAEAQAREAQIEAALERVRSKTMAMHSSSDVGDTVATMFDEFVKLDIHTNRCGILIFSDEPAGEVWTAKSNPEGKSNLIIGKLDMTVHPLLHGIHKAWKKKKTFYTYLMEGDDLRNYYRALNDLEYYPVKFDMNALPSKEFHSDFYFPEGSVFTFTTEPLPDEASRVIKRFAAVFGQTYRRYLDLLKAEAQAREATIEAALEKVRGKAMAMYNSNDLSVTASMVFTELRKLGINPIRSGVGIFNKQSRSLQFYSAAQSVNGDSLSMTGGVNISSHPIFEKQYEAWLKNENYFTVLKGDELKAYYKVLSKSYVQSDFKNRTQQEEYGHWLMFSEGFLFAWADAPYNDTDIKTLKRFASIIDLTFRRYFELQKSEANAREAVKQAALDRIRADIASMRSVADLNRITPLIWNELTILGIPFIRCGVFIMDDSQQLIHTFLSTPDGKAIAAFHLLYDTPGNIALVLSHWRKKEKYLDHWDEAVFTDFAHTLVKQGALASAEEYLKTLPPGGFYLHFLPFLQGMLYVGNTNQLGEDEIDLLQSVADAFATAYARYEDFNKLEAAKQQVDKTLVDLRQAQQQLVQSEKMASLGELTAGIAHEIQNPLNFVNNFSEVSNELLDEMMEAAGKGDFDEVKEILNDVKQNLEKINHHGKRADGIVKGMLQHSRSSSGQKEPTDINALADEYLRLAYHGLRAKDKSFNATMKTDYDATLGKVNVIPQDIGRVILNLITNAFYVVNEKKNQGLQGYEPTVTVKTLKSPSGGLGVCISVADNGNGIPQKVLDKIFQPFFTTKPTGQGTGLGLSLSYDIVKAHGGEIKVNTKENEGTEFVIQIPITA